MKLFGAANSVRPGMEFVEALEPIQLLATVPSGFSDARITSGISRGTAMALAPDGRFFIAEQGGKLRVVKNNALLSNAFVTVTTVMDASEGLIGVAVDPQFSTNKYIYVSYTKSGPLRTVISRFTANGDVALSGSEKVLFTSDELQNHEHNGGALAFGPDGKLYIALGDDLTIGNAQSKSTTQGKILRINKDGTIPTDNPFYNSTSGSARAIWAYGFRNPFTLSFQPGTGRLFSGDVGSDFWEEVNEVKKGANYGWSNSEGPTTNPGETTPFFAYQHQTFGECVIGGSFYNPSTVKFPSSYVGKYFFSDYVRGWIKTLDPSTGAVGNFISGLDRCISMITAPDGSFYYLLRGGFGTGELHRVTYATTGAPVITQQPQSQSIVLNQSATFEIAASGATPMSYQWRRNGKNISGATGSAYRINTVGSGDNGALFDCIVTNPAGTKTSNAAKLTVIFDTPPEPVINLPSSNHQYFGGEAINFSGSATDEEDGTIDSSKFSWTVVFHHDTHTHPAYGPIDGVKSGSFEIPSVEETSDNVYYELVLTVTDSHGVSSTVSRNIMPLKVQFTVAPSVPGLSVGVDAVTYSDSPTITGVVGIRRQISAPLVQVLNGAVYQFANWSDGGAATHYVNTPDSNVTYTAHYVQIGTVPIGDGINASYYDNSDFTGTKKTRIDKQINFIWSKDPPISGIGADSFSVRWSGYVVAPTSEKYTFYLNIDDGAKLWVNNTLLIDKFSSTGLKEYSGSITLTAGKKYAIKVEYKDVSSYAQAQLGWSSPQLARQVVPQSALFTSNTQTPPPTPSPSPTTTILAGADTYVRGGDYATTNFGGDPTLVVKNDVDTRYSRETYLRFDLSQLTTITSAQLKLFGKLNASSSMTVGIYAAASTPTWDEKTLTWNTRFNSNPTPIATVSVTGTTDASYTADLTAFLKNELALGRTSVTFILKGTAVSSNAATFHSREGANVPQLLVS